MRWGSRVSWCRRSRSSVFLPDSNVLPRDTGFQPVLATFIGGEIAIGGL